MANNLNKQILEDGYRNAVVKLTALLDSSNVTWVPAVALTDFLQNDRMMGELVGLRIDRLDYSSGPKLVTSVEWNSNSPQLIAAFAQSDELSFAQAGGVNPNRQIAGYDGAINVRTKGYVAGEFEAFSLILRMVKIYSQSGN